MRVFPPQGATLPELILAMVLLSGLALASAPVAVRTALVQARSRALSEGAHLAASRRALLGAVPCGTTASGTDTTRRARLRWSVAPADSTLLLTALLDDPRGRWPAESVATVLRCDP